MTIGVLVRSCFLVFSIALNLSLFNISAAAQTHLKGQLLYEFAPTAPNGVNATGANPNGALVEDAQGRLYGVTYNGGSSGQGTIFRLTKPITGASLWTEEVLLSFEDQPNLRVQNGENPTDGLAIDEAGVLYGTTSFGGEYGYGLVFSFNPSTAVYTILHNFQPGTRDGLEPATSLTFGSGGLLYGTTTTGGSEGNGAVFSISPLGDKTEYSIIHSFQAKDAADGDMPYSRLISGGPSKFYGTTFGGGEFHVGTVYSLNLNESGIWVENVLHSFQTGTSDLNSPFRSGDLVRGPQGVLYGTTADGGLYNEGGIYQLTPPGAAGGVWQETILHVTDYGKGDFQGRTTLLLQPSGQLLGTGAAGGGKTGSGQGGIFQLTPPASTGGEWFYKELFLFGTSPDGETPTGPLIRHGNYYAGVNGYNYTDGTGTVYEFQVKTTPDQGE